MKLIRSGENTLRITMTVEDLDRYCVSLEDFDELLPHKKRIFRELMALAKKETGFDASYERVYIQLYPKKDGGCELFIIKLEEEREESYFLFQSFEDFYCGSALLDGSEGFFSYKIKGKDWYLMRLAFPYPPLLAEYGERIKTPPSETFLKAKCTPIQAHLKRGRI